MTVFALIVLILLYTREMELNKMELYTSNGVMTFSENERHSLFITQQEKMIFNRLKQRSVNPYYPDDLELQLVSDQGKIKEQQPFSDKLIQKISIFIDSKEGQKTYTVPPENTEMIVQALYSMDLTTARANMPKPSEEGLIYIRFHTADHVYFLSYDLNSNTYEIGGKRYYATYNTLVYLNQFCREDTLLAKLGEMRMIDIQTVREANDMTDKIPDDVNRFKINSRNFEDWYYFIDRNKDYNKKIRFYSIRSDKINTINVNEQAGILFTGASLFFTKDTVQTADGISVGSSTEDILNRLGVPDLMQPNKWSYELDQEQLHFYIKQKKVQYISLTTES